MGVWDWRKMVPLVVCCGKLTLKYRVNPFTLGGNISYLPII